MIKKTILLFVALICLSSCAVTESINFNEDGSGEYLMDMDMSMFVRVMQDKTGGGNTEKKDGKVVDSVMYFNDLIKEYGDSLQTLPPEQQKAIQALENMYFKMKMDENAKEMRFGIGMYFTAIDDLKDINKKINEARKMADKNGQSDSMKNTPIGKFMGGDENDTQYSYTTSSFSRTTTFPEDYNIDEIQELFEAKDDEDQELIDMFSEATYRVTYSFPKAIKTINIDQPKFSKDRKQVSYNISWLDYLKNPKLLDIQITFDE